MIYSVSKNNYAYIRVRKAQELLDSDRTELDQILFFVSGPRPRETQSFDFNLMTI